VGSELVARLDVLAAALLFSTGGAAIKACSLSSWQVASFRSAVACLVVLAILPESRRRWSGRTLAGGFAYATTMVLFVVANKLTTAANTIFLQYTAPIYVALIGPFILSERLRSREAVPFVICIAGIAVLFLGNSGSGETKGLLLGAGSGFFYGMFFIWLRRLRYADAIAITLINCLGVVVLLVAVPSVWQVSAMDIVLLVIMATVQFALPYVLFTRGVAHVPVAEASLIALIEPVLNPVWVALLYGENPSVATIVGGAVILAGLAVRYTVLRPTTLELEAGAAELAGGPAVPEGGEGST